MRSNNPKISIIIPTYNRAESLKRVVEGLLNQTSRDFEIIIVDDGSTDQTESVIKALLGKIPFELHYLKQANKGAGAARNLGIRHAKGELILCIDDDVLPSPTLLEEHIIGHQRHGTDNIAIVGSIAYAPELKVSPFMRWLINLGPHFWHSREENEAKLDYHCFCTANISLNRRFMLEKGMFDETFRPFFEDIELGYRLKQQGLEIVLNKHAVGYHLRGEAFESFCKRSESAGRSGALFHAKWPETTPSVNNATPGAITALSGAMKSFTMEIMIPILKPVIGWLDSHNYAVPAVLYVLVLSYYSHVGYRKAIKSLENLQNLE